uniref:L-Fucosyltransferase n=1 Tax=Caenorhabditis tropicalis TaxID=1561998 RepID=A0A1I7TW09_9PELO
MSRKLNRIPTFFIQDDWHDQMLKDTDFLIPGLVDHFLIINRSLPVAIIPTDFHMSCCKWDNPTRLMNITSEYLHIRGMHFQSWKYFARMRNELIGYLKKPTNLYENLPKSNDASFITCVHIRRTDFLTSGFHVPDRSFIISAMKFVEENERKRKNYSLNMTTVFFGDDLEYIKNLFNETYVLNGEKKDLDSWWFVSKDDPTDSILYSRHHCDVVLITAPHSTFGWWLGFLSKGNQVYYTDIKYVNDVSIAGLGLVVDDYYPPHWTPFKYDEYDNSTIIETLK